MHHRLARPAVAGFSPCHECRQCRTHHVHNSGQQDGIKSLQGFQSRCRSCRPPHTVAIEAQIPGCTPDTHENLQLGTLLASTRCEAHAAHRGTAADCCSKRMLTSLSAPQGKIQGAERLCIGDMLRALRERTAATIRKNSEAMIVR